MKKILLLLNVLFYLVITASQTDQISIVAVGNFQGEYKDLAKIKSFYKDYTRTNSSFIFLNIGNNLQKEKEINDIFTRFYQEMNVDVNVAGSKEILYGDINNYTSLNLVSDKVKAYEIVEEKNYKFAVIALSEIYDHRLEAYDYNEELQKLLYKLDKKVDFVTIVSELSREENINLVKNFKEIDLIIENSDNQYNKRIVDYDGAYIIPLKGFAELSFSYNTDLVKSLGENIQNISRHGLILKNRENYNKNYINYNEDEIFKRFVEIKEQDLNYRFKLVIGQNPETFVKEDIFFGNSIKFLDQNFRKIMFHNDIDVMIMPYELLSGGLKKGLYTVKDLKELFNKDNVIEIRAKESVLAKITMANKVGKKDYLYIYGQEQSGIKTIYKVISFENLLKNYEEEEFEDVIFYDKDMFDLLMEVR